MYGHRDQSYSGEKRDRHPHHRGSSSHSSRDRSKKQHREGRKERDHGGSHRVSSRRVSSGGGKTDNEGGNRGMAGTTDLMSVRRSSRDSSHHVRSSDNRSEDFVRGSQSGRSNISRGSSVDELVGGRGVTDSLPIDVSTEVSGKSDETSSVSTGFGAFILHEAISPPSEDFESGSIKAGGFEICMPVIRSNSNDSLTNTSFITKRRPEDLWGAVVELRTTPIEPQQAKAALYERDWKPGFLTCNVPKAADMALASSQAEKIDKEYSVLDHPRDKHGRNLVLHSIDMQQYIHKMQNFLATVANDQDRELDPTEIVPDKPQRFYTPTGSSSKVLTSDQISKLPSVNLTQQGLNQLLRKSAAAICSFSGYECSTPESLDVLSDVLGKYLANFSKLLHMNADHCSVSNDCCGFQDAMERSLHQTGVDGKEGLCRYWKEEVQGQARLLDMDADELRNTCLTMMMTEDLHRSSKPPALSSPFSSSHIFATDDQETTDVTEEISLEIAMKESRARPQLNDPVNAPPDSYSALTSPDLGPLDCFGPFEIDGPPRKRLRTSPIDQDWNKT